MFSFQYKQAGGIALVLSIQSSDLSLFSIPIVFGTGKLAGIRRDALRRTTLKLRCYYACIFLGSELHVSVYRGLDRQHRDGGSAKAGGGKANRWRKRGWMGVYKGAVSRSAV